jgi:imidazolonepropionase-like amidohydrolase
MAETVDRLFVHCKELVTLTDGAPTGPRRGAQMQQLGVIEDGAIAVREGRIVAVGPTERIARDYRAAEELDLSGYVVMPGFVDCHTHPVFARTRENEFHMRCAGADYMAIAQSGGGILSSMRAVREMSLEELTARTERHLWGFAANGTTTVECKSGYGLSLADEEKSLLALQAAARELPLTIKRTFLGAHEFPPEYRENRDEYVRLLCEQMMPRLASSPIPATCSRSRGCSIVRRAIAFSPRRAPLACACVCTPTRSSRWAGPNSRSNCTPTRRTISGASPTRASGAWRRATRSACCCPARSSSSASRTTRRRGA